MMFALETCTPTKGLMVRHVSRPTRTRYVIERTSTGCYWDGGGWTPHLEQAYRFEFMSVAMGTAIVDLDMKPGEYSVNPILGGRTS